MAGALMVFLGVGLALPSRFEDKLDRGCGKPYPYSLANRERSDPMSDQGRLAGKKALVTGSGTGIGRGVAIEFARQGADVVLHYGHSAAGAQSAVEEIQAMGRRSLAVQANFENTDEAVGLANRAIEFLGGIDCLVNNSGITMNRPFLKVTRQQYDVLLNVNLRSPYFLAQRIVEDMLSHGERLEARRAGGPAA